MESQTKIEEVLHAQNITGKMGEVTITPSSLNDELPLSTFLPKPQMGSIHYISTSLNLSIGSSENKSEGLRQNSLFSEEEEKLWENVKGTKIGKPLKEDKKLRAARKRLAKKHALDLTEIGLEKWIARRQMTSKFKFSVVQKRELKKWFDSMDNDGSGEIGVEELAIPLLSTGIAQSTHEVAEIIKKVDKDGSGEIGFQEFLEVLRPRTPKLAPLTPRSRYLATRRANAQIQTGGSNHFSGGTNPPKPFLHPESNSPLKHKKKRSLLQSSSANALGRSTAKDGNNAMTALAHMLGGSNQSGLTIDLLANMQRRQLLMDAVVDETRRREDQLTDLDRQIDEARTNHDYQTLRKLKTHTAALERRKQRKQNYIKAVKHTTQWEKEEIIEEEEEDEEVVVAKPENNNKQRSRRGSILLPSLSYLGLGGNAARKTAASSSFQKTKHQPKAQSSDCLPDILPSSWYNRTNLRGSQSGKIF